MIFTSFRCDILFKLTLQAARGRVRGKSKRCHVPVPWQGGLEVVHYIYGLAGGGNG